MKLLFKVVNREYYAKFESIFTLIQYAKGNDFPYTAGVNCSSDAETAIRQFESTIQHFNKCPARFIRHYVLSSDYPYATEHFLQIAYLVASKYLPTNQVFIGVHTDTDHIHAHLIINCVNCYSGKIFSYSHEEHDAFIAHAAEFNIQLECPTTIL